MYLLVVYSKTRLRGLTSYQLRGTRFDPKNDKIKKNEEILILDNTVKFNLPPHMTHLVHFWEF